MSHHPNFSFMGKIIKNWLEFLQLVVYDVGKEERKKESPMGHFASPAVLEHIL